VRSIDSPTLLLHQHSAYARTTVIFQVSMISVQSAAVRPRFTRGYFEVFITPKKQLCFTGTVKRKTSNEKDLSMV